jgi:hypothetical protein
MSIRIQPAPADRTPSSVRARSVRDISCSRPPAAIPKRTAPPAGRGFGFATFWAIATPATTMSAASARSAGRSDFVGCPAFTTDYRTGASPANEDNATVLSGGFRYLLALADGEPADPAAFITAVPEWRPGETFVGSNGQLFRILAIEPEMAAGTLDESVGSSGGPGQNRR